MAQPPIYNSDRDLCPTRQVHNHNNNNNYNSNSNSNSNSEDDVGNQTSNSNHNSNNNSKRSVASWSYTPYESNNNNNNNSKNGGNKDNDGVIGKNTTNDSNNNELTTKQENQTMDDNDKDNSSSMSQERNDSIEAPDKLANDVGADGGSMGSTTNTSNVVVTQDRSAAATTSAGKAVATSSANSTAVQSENVGGDGDGGGGDNEKSIRDFKEHQDDMDLDEAVTQAALELAVPGTSSTVDSVADQSLEIAAGLAEETTSMTRIATSNEGNAADASRQVKVKTEEQLTPNSATTDLSDNDAKTTTAATNTTTTTSTTSISCTTTKTSLTPTSSSPSNSNQHRVVPSLLLSSSTASPSQRHVEPPASNNIKQETSTLAAVKEESDESAMNARDDAVALAAMQEAAAMVMEEEEKKKRKASEISFDSSSTNLESIMQMAAAATAPTTSPDQNPKKRNQPTRISWEDRLKQLQDYKQQHGNLLIPIRYKLNPSLGKFVHNTREQFKLYHKQTPEGYKKKCSLTAERIQQLEQLGFVWSTERTKQQNEDWQARLKQLEEYRAKHGHCLVPHGYTVDPSFAEWIHRQRTTYASMLKEEKMNPKVKERMDQLKNLGFNFTVHSDKWMDHWAQLKEYKEKHGDCQVPTHYAENPKLGRWVHTQRHQRRLQSKGKKSCMTQDRIDLLDKLGFSWEVRSSLERPRATWQQRLEELTEYYKCNNNFMVDPSTMPQLHAWCHEQRQRLRHLDKNNGKDVSKRMGPERVEALKALGFTKDALLSDKPVVVSASEKAGSISSTNEAKSLDPEEAANETNEETVDSASFSYVSAHATASTTSASSKQPLKKEEDAATTPSSKPIDMKVATESLNDTSVKVEEGKGRFK